MPVRNECLGFQSIFVSKNHQPDKIARKNDLIVVKVNWEASGANGGGGSRMNKNCCDYGEEDEYSNEGRTMGIHVNGKKNCLLRRSAAVIFL
jgi:hypothetical protein